MKTKRCAIIGSNGYIGRHFNWYLRQMGIIADCYGIADNAADHYTRVDLTDKNSVAKINLDVDIIFLFAGLTGTYAGFDNYEKFVSVNEVALLHLLDTIRHSVFRPRIIFPSTRLVYRGEDRALDEQAPKESKTVYAVNKQACEGYLQAFYESFQIPYTIFRICIPYGNLLGKDYSFGTIGFFIRQASQGKDITLYGDGDMKRTFTYMEDLCYQMVYGAFNDKAAGEIYNIDGETFSLREVAEMIARHYGVKVVSVPWPEKDWAIESGHTFFDGTKISSLLEGYQRHSLKGWDFFESK